MSVCATWEDVQLTSNPRPLPHTTKPSQQLEKLMLDLKTVTVAAENTVCYLNAIHHYSVADSLKGVLSLVDGVPA